MTDHPASPDSSSPPDWDALARLVSGESTPEESAQLRRVLAEDGARAELVSVLGALGRTADPAPPSSAEIQAALMSVLARRDPVVAGTPVIHLAAHRGRRMTTAWRVAAAIVVIVGAGTLWRASRQGSVPAESLFSSAVGAVREITLSDGTKVTLGPASTLRLGTGYGGSARDVTLDGEARFDVVHNEAKPFIVHTSTAAFRDVGTVFAVQTNGAEGSRVAVSAGAVAVQGVAPTSAVTLRAGDRALVSSGGAVAVERSVVTERDFSWTKGELVFDDETVGQVVAEVRRWYGVDIAVDSTLGSRRITATFARTDDRTTIARTIASVLGGGVQDAGATVRIVPAPAAPSRK